MTSIKIEFPADRMDIALAMGAALLNIGGGGEPTESNDGPGETIPDESLFNERKAANDETCDKDQAPTEVDPKGVGFDPQFCGKAKKPFYASGSREGQWKKRQGVTDEAYDAWYSGTQPVVSQATESTVDTASAFGGAPEMSVPSDCGAFMVWVSSQQAAGLLTQQQITNVYMALGLEVTALFPPNTPEVVAHNVAALHSSLSKLIAQQ